MSTRIKTVTIAALLGLAPTAALAGYFDGKHDLLCSMHQLFECDAPNACQAVTPDQINAFSHLDVDFGSRSITRAGVESTQESDIEVIETGVDGKLIISGIEDGSPNARDGAGWTISIMDPEGTMVLAVAGDGFAVVGLGACVPKP